MRSTTRVCIRTNRIVYMSKSIKINYIYTIANTFLGLIFPIITFPYISRVLQPEGVGLYNFYNSILTYITLLANAGISLYATKKIAQHRDDVPMRSKLTVEILLLHFMTTVCAYGLVIALNAFVPRIHENQLLFFVMSFSLIFGPLSVNWFFQAVEDFKYITIRSFVVKFISLILLLVFVKTKEDVLNYAIVLLIANVGNNLFNIIHLRKYIFLHDIKWRSLQILCHLKPSLLLFILSIAVSIYVNLDTVMLGFMQTDVAVGYYSVAGRISHIILSVVTSMGVVLLPRFSYLHESHKYDEFNRLCRKSMDFIVGLSLPMVVGIVLMADPMIKIIFGVEYNESITVLQLLSPIILFAGITNVLGIQILYPMGKEKLVIYSTIGAAVANLTMNMILIPIYSYNGAALATCVAEFIVLGLQMTLGKKYFPSGLFSRDMFDYLLATVLMGLSVFAIMSVGWVTWCGSLAIPVFVGLIVYGSVLLWRKNVLVVNIVDTIKTKIKWI